MNTSKAKRTPGPWRAANTTSHQGLIISERTGANVAVAYDKRDAALIAEAPNLLLTCVIALTKLELMTTREYSQGGDSLIRSLLADAIARVEDGEER